MLQVNDRVVVVGSVWAMNSSLGKMGTIARVDSTDCDMPYFVEFDDGGDDWVGVGDIILVGDDLQLQQRIELLEKEVKTLKKLLEAK